MTHKSLLEQFISFLGVGAIATACHYLLLILLVEVLSVRVLIASTLGALLGAIVSYILNRKMTFQSEIAHQTALPKFLSVAAFALIMNWLLMKFFTEITLLPYLIAQCITTILLIIITFGLNKIWSFKE